MDQDVLRDTSAIHTGVHFWWKRREIDSDVFQSAAPTRVHPIRHPLDIHMLLQFIYKNLISNLATRILSDSSWILLAKFSLVAEWSDELNGADCRRGRSRPRSTNFAAELMQISFE